MDAMLPTEPMLATLPSEPIDAMLPTLASDATQPALAREAMLPAELREAIEPALSREAMLPGEQSSASGPARWRRRLAAMVTPHVRTASPRRGRPTPMHCRWPCVECFRAPGLGGYSASAGSSRPPAASISPAGSRSSSHRTRTMPPAMSRPPSAWIGAGTWPSASQA